MMTSNNNSTIQQLYIAYFQRPADPAGREFWSGALETIAPPAISAEFSRSPEYRGLVAGKDYGDAVDALYLNLLGRHADSEGLAFYRGALEAGKATLDFVAADILKGAVGSDAEIIDNKVIAAELFTTALGIDPASIQVYAQNGNQGREFLASVSGDRSLYEAIGKLSDMLEIVVTKTAGSASLPTLGTQEMVQELFLAYFKRPAMVSELEAWSAALASSSLEAVSLQLSQTEEYAASVKDLNAQQIVDRLYMNLFARHGDEAGLKFYGEALSNGAIKLEQLVCDFIGGVQGGDREALENRAIGAELFTISLQSDPVTRVSYAAFQQPGRDFIEHITSDASVYQALRGLPNVLQEMVSYKAEAGHAELVGLAPQDHGFWGA